jgi:TolB-like protein/tRNA A-37 threonylcarbamoyl transferase component Bud32/Flp pilus assembly protein TadD
MVVVRRRPRLIGRVVSHYRILEHLGGGGMGVVYKAEDAKLHRVVALKFLAAELTKNASAKERFLHEARAASALDHPNICTIYEVDETLEGQLYLAMAFYDGETLEERIYRGPLPPAEAIGIALQVARGLGRAHETGIIHRDIKPANIIITPRGEAKIVDFGLAKLAGQVGLTRNGSSMGTPTYMSPEQADGKPVDARTDIWSLGVVLYEMVTGKKPFVGEHLQLILQALLHTEPEPPTWIVPTIPKALERVIAGCLKKDPDERYPSCQALIAALAPLLESSQEVTLGPTPALQRAAATAATAAMAAMAAPPALSPNPPKAPRRPSLRALAAIGILVGVVLLLTAGGVLLWRHGWRPAGPAGDTGNTGAVGTIGGTAGDNGALPDRQRIVVLPFENLGPPEDAYFASGITEEITSRLAAIHGLAVISRTSALQYERARKSVKEIGRELGVDYVLEGSVRWERPASGPSRVRVTPQLIRVADDTHLWAERYDRDGGEIFKVQSDIAEQVIAQLNVNLLKPERQLLDARPTTNLEAYQAYLRGRAHMENFAPVYSEEAGKEAVEGFERAVALDPRFAEAWAGLSLAESAITQGGFDPSGKALARSRTAVLRALALSPQLPDAHIAMGYYLYWGSRAYEPAIRELAIAATAHAKQGEVAEAMGYIRRRQGRHQEALAEFEQAFALDPRNANLALNLGELEALLRHYEQAEGYFDTAIALAPVEFVGYFQKSICRLLWKGSVPEARAILDAAPPTDDPFMTMAHFGLDLYERRYDQALTRLTAIKTTWITEGDDSFPKATLVGQLRAARGETALAHAAFEESRTLIEQQLAEHPQDPRLHSSLGIADAGLGRREEAIREGRRGVSLSPIERDAVNGVQRVNELAQIYAMLGDGRAASEQVAVLLSHPTMISAALLDLDPIFDPVRRDPRFQKVLHPVP